MGDVEFKNIISLFKESNIQALEYYFAIIYSYLYPQPYEGIYHLIRPKYASLKIRPKYASRPVRTKTVKMLENLDGTPVWAKSILEHFELI